MAEIIKKDRAELARNITDITPTPAEFYIQISNRNAQEILFGRPRSKEEPILANVDTGIK